MVLLQSPRCRISFRLQHAGLTYPSPIPRHFHPQPIITTTPSEDATRSNTLERWAARYSHLLRSPRPDKLNGQAPLQTRFYSSIAFRKPLVTTTHGHASLSHRASTTVTQEAETLPGSKYSCSTHELMDLVELYSSVGETSRDTSKPTHRDGVQHESEDTTEDAEVEGKINNEETIRTKTMMHTLLDDEEASHDHLFELYQSLPEPRGAQMSRVLLDRLLQQFSQVEHATEASMMRFLSIIDGAKATNRRIYLQHWNMAIFFAGRCFKKISGEQLQHAIQIWREMEGQAGVAANDVTFNILFDIAAKSGKFLLADMIYNEMKERGIPYTRYFRTSLIYHYGLRRDGDGIRRAYADLINAGEVVDTVVINCVISAFLLCGEATTAEQTFERAKQLHASKTNQLLPPSHWRQKKKLGRYLARLVRSKRAIEESKSPAQQILDGPFTPNLTSTSSDPSSDSSNAHGALAGGLTDVSTSEEETSVAPDLQTYKALIQYHAVTAGDIDRVASLIDEMEHYSVPLDGSIFLFLFRAFQAHGGILYTQWTVRRLQNTWASYLAAVDSDDGAGLVYASRPVALLAVKAFLQCTDVLRAAEAWAVLRPRLRDISDEEMVSIDEDIAVLMGDDAGLYWDVLRWKKVDLPEDQREQPVDDNADSPQDTGEQGETTNNGAANKWL